MVVERNALRTLAAAATTTVATVIAFHIRNIDSLFQSLIIRYAGPDMITLVLKDLFQRWTV
jgi:hypothetical protein